jgi:hypothetical protein
MAADGGIRAGIGRWAVSLGFYLYALLAAPWLARGFKAGLASEDPVWWPGVVVLVVLGLEPFGLRAKLRFLRRRNQEEGFQPEGPALAGFSAAGIAHVLVPLFLFFYLPMRLPFLLDEYHLRPARGRRGRLAAELGMGAVLGLYPVFFG